MRPVPSEEKGANARRIRKSKTPMAESNMFTFYLRQAWHAGAGLLNFWCATRISNGSWTLPSGALFFVAFFLAQAMWHQAIFARRRRPGCRPN